MIDAVKDWFAGLFVQETGPQVISVDDLPNASYGYGGYGSGIEYWSGEKFPGGLGAAPMEIWDDYYEQRRWSNKVFKQNLYGKGLIRRLITNEIHTGLMVECIPDELTLGLEEDALQDWSDDVERRFELWGRAKDVCDYTGQSTFNKIQDIARREALIEGDVLVILRVDPKTKQRAIQLVSGSCICNPYDAQAMRNLPEGHTLKYGVQRDAKGRHVAYWIKQENGKVEKLNAIGKKSGRPVAWLVYGSGDRRVGEVRGEPLLTTIIQSLNELDKYRDSMQRKAVVNSMLAMFYEKGDDRPGTGGMSNGIRSRTVVDAVEASGSAVASTTETRSVTIDSGFPGIIHNELAKGEKPHAFSSAGAELPFVDFETAVVRAIAWSNGCPPEILELSFNSNYSASQAALSEFNMVLIYVRQDFATQFNQPVYEQWLITEILLRKINAPGLLQAWRNPAEYEVYQSWMRTEWYGSVKPSTDPVKTGKGYEKFVEHCWTTNTRAARAISGTNFTRNAKRIAKENALKAEAARPLAEFQQEFGVSPDQVGQNTTTSTQTAEMLAGFKAELLESVAELIESRMEDA